MPVLRGSFCDYCGYYVPPNEGRIVMKYNKPVVSVRLCKDCYKKEHDGIERIDMYAIYRNRVRRSD